MNWECRKVLAQGLQEDDKIVPSINLPPMQCITLCDGIPFCRSVQLIKAEHIGMCNIYKSIAPVIPPLTSVATIFDYYCYKGKSRNLNVNVDTHSVFMTRVNCCQ